MRFLEARSWIWTAGWIWLAIGLLAGGCQTEREALFEAGGVGWRVREGQALWRPRGKLPEFGGELVLATHEDGRWALQFAKTPVPLVLAQRKPPHWLIRFPPRQLSLSGSGAVPARIAWLHLPDALAGKTLPSPLTFQRLPEGGWRLENPRTGETLQGYLAP